MSEQDNLPGQVEHYIQKLQAKVATVVNTKSAHPPLQWGQFVVEGKENSQVGVYGSSCAAIVLKLNGRDDDAARNAEKRLSEYVATADAEYELAHNIKLALVILALAPHPGVQASAVMLQHLKILLDRYEHAAKLWPAYTRPNRLKGVAFAERGAEVASAAILILLYQVRRRLSHAAHIAMLGQIDAILEATAGTLENAYAANRAVLARHSILIAVAVILVKGVKAHGPIKFPFKEAVQKRDFADRRVFFYDCLRQDGQLSRDYFILPAATILPLVAEAEAASPMQRALALDVAPALLSRLDDDGLFKGEQDLASTVEQGFLGLSLAAIVKGVSKRDWRQHCSRAWLYASQPSPTGSPTKLVYIIVFLLWSGVGILVLGKYMPQDLREIRILKHLYLLSGNSPEAVSQFLSFLAAAWPTSRAVFFRLIGKDRP